MRSLKHQGRWLLAVVLVLTLSLAVVFAPQVQASAQEGDGGAEQLNLAPIMKLLSRAGVADRSANQIYRDDLTVEAGQTLEGDVIVYSGNADIESGGAIGGDLVVYSGDIEIESGANIAGDVAAFSGDIELAGTVEGSVASWSGDVTLADSAYVGGDISVLSGDIDKAQSAYVGGNLVEGPSFKLGIPSARGFSSNLTPNGDTAPLAQFRVDSPSFAQRLLAFMGRLVLALVVTVVVALLAAGLIAIRPAWVDTVKTTMVEQTALSFAFGLVTNLVLLFLASILLITICLSPLALAPISLLLALNLAGWTALSKEVGQRLVDYTHAPVQPVVATALGALVVTGVPAMLWSFGGCFRFMALMTVLLVASAGAGAVLLPWLNRQRALTVGEDGEDLQAPVAQAEDTQAADMQNEDSQTDLATVASASAATAEVVAAAEPEASDVQPGEDVKGTPDEADGAATAEGVSPVLDAPAVSDEVQPSPARPAGADDDFTRISGIGPAFERRLKAANLRTYAALASLSASELADILGWTTERVTRENLLGQAADLAEAQ